MRLMTLATLAGITLGCAPKKLVQPIQGPATARYGRTMAEAQQDLLRLKKNPESRPHMETAALV
jgi:hypothetical protein